MRRYWAVYQLDITVILVLIFQAHEEQLKNVYTSMKVSFLATSFQSVTRIFTFRGSIQVSLRNCTTYPSPKPTFGVK